MTIPGWYPLLLLAGASYRMWRLLALDAILDGPRTRLILGDRDEDGDPVAGDGYRAGLDDFMQCPWCLGAHLSLGIYLLWVWQPEWTLAVCTPLSLSAIVGLISQVDRQE